MPFRVHRGGITHGLAGLALDDFTQAAANLSLAASSAAAAGP
jgi:hypothetical protein